MRTCRLRSWPFTALLLSVGVLTLSAACSVRIGGKDDPAAAGSLVCEMSEQCPLPESSCLASMCLDEVCVYVVAPRGPLPAEEQQQGNCQRLYCDGDGNVESFDNPGDVPAEDNNRCTEAACDGGAAVQLPRIAGAACGEKEICSGTGHCGVCLPDAQRCEAHALTQCDERGQWQPKQLCAGTRQPLCRAAHCTGVKQLAAAHGHVCARFDDGSLRCWGHDSSGWSGGGKPSQGWAAGYLQLAVGDGHSCGVRQDGSVWCWGRNAFGQLGDGSLTFRAAAVRVSLPAAQHVAVGRAHSCALLRDGAVRCWGRNDHGQLGSGSITAVADAPPDVPLAALSGRPRPQPVLLKGVAATAPIRGVGTSLCVNGACYGAAPHYRADDFPPKAEDDSAVRDKAIEARKKLVKVTPAAVVGGPMVQLGCGDHHCCTRSEAGTVQCWGANDHRQLGAPGAARSASATLADLSSVVDLAVGANFACVRHSDGKVRCFGDNRVGQLGRAAAPNGGPELVASLLDVSQLSSGRRFVCALRQSGLVTCWGDIASPTAAAVKPPHDVIW